MSVSCACCVLSGRGFCVCLVTHSQESYWFLIWISWVLYLNLKNRFELMFHDDMDFYPKLYLYVVDTCLYLLMIIAYIYIWWQFPHLYDLWNMNKWINEWMDGSAAAHLLDLRIRTCRGHLCLSFVSVVSCQVEVSTLGWSLVQGNYTECEASEWVRGASIMKRQWPSRSC